MGALPQLKDLYAIEVYDGHALSGYGAKGELASTLINSLASFCGSSNTGWYAKNETPLGNKHHIGQIGLEGELDRDFLLIRKLRCGDSNLHLLLQFSPIVLSPNNYLSASEKKVLEHCISSLLKQFLATQQTDKAVLTQIAKSNQLYRSELDELSMKLKQTSQSFESTLKQMLKLLFARLEKKVSLSINYSPSFAKAVLEFTGNYDELEEHLEEQVTIESNIAILNGLEEVILDEIHVRNLKVRSRVNKESAVPLSLGRLAKAHALLDKYELAAERAQQIGLSVIGKNIGAHCSPPISNAAITDAIGKNAKKIYELFEKYPEKWPIIRSEFRSIGNVIEKESARRQAS